MLEQRAEKLCGVQTAGATRATGMMVALTSSAQLNEEGVRCNILLFKFGTSFVSSPPLYLMLCTPSLSAVRAMVHAISLADDVTVGLGNMGIGLVDVTRLLNDAGGGLVLVDGGRGILDVVAQLLTVGTCAGDTVMLLAAFNTVWT